MNTPIPRLATVYGHQIMFALLPICLIVISVSACKTLDETAPVAKDRIMDLPSIQVASTRTPSAAVASTVTPVIVQIPSQTMFPAQPTPEFQPQPGHGSLILSTGASPNCDLPCWHNLAIGTSHQDDVEHVFAYLFDPTGNYDFFVPPQRTDVMSNAIANLDGFDAGGHTWDFEDPTTGIAGSHSLYAELDTSTGLLAGIIESMDSYTLYDVPSLPETLVRLGRPALIFIDPSDVTYGVIMYYERGIRVSMYIEVFRDSLASRTVCFDQEPIGATVILVDPYISSDLADLSTMQRMWEKRTADFPQIEDTIGLSLDEFLALVNSDQPCIHPNG